MLSGRCVRSSFQIQTHFTSVNGSSVISRAALWVICGLLAARRCLWAASSSYISIFVFHHALSGLRCSRLPLFVSLLILFPAVVSHMWIITHRLRLAPESLISGAEMADLFCGRERGSEWRQLSPLLTWNNCLHLSAVILSLLFSMNAWALLNKNVLQFLGWKGKLSLFCSEWNGVISRGEIKRVGLKLSLKPATFQGTVIPDPGGRFLLIVLYFCWETFRTCQKTLKCFQIWRQVFFFFSSEMFLFQRDCQYRVTNV